MAHPLRAYAHQRRRDFEPTFSRCAGWLRLTALALAVVGVLLLLQSTALGLAAADGLLRAAGGMDQEGYMALLEASMEAYRLLGAVLLGVGMFRLLEYYA